MDNMKPYKPTQTPEDPRFEPGWRDRATLRDKLKKVKYRAGSRVFYFSKNRLRKKIIKINNYLSLFSIVCPHSEHFHFSKTSSLYEKGSRYPNLHFGHFGKIHEFFKSSIFYLAISVLISSKGT